MLGATTGALVGLAGGFLAHPYLPLDGTKTVQSVELVPLALNRIEWPYPDYDATRTRYRPNRTNPFAILLRPLDRRPETELHKYCSFVFCSLLLTIIVRLTALVVPLKTPK